MSFYTSLNGLKNAQTDLGVISQQHRQCRNQRLQEEPHRLLPTSWWAAPYYKPQAGVGIGASSGNQSPELRAWRRLEQTGSALDLAINGDGFFTTKNVVNGRKRSTPATAA